MDTFAQTGAQQDDLFDDIQYNDESMQTRQPEDLFNDDFTPVEEPIVETPAPQTFQKRGGREHGPPRGRGRARDAIRGGRSAPIAPSQVEQAPPIDTPPVQAPMGGLGASRHAPQPPKPSPAPQSVRGDRTLTGGPQRAKLSEAELAEKMSRITLKNASLEAAHARAEADAASFNQREAEAAVRRKEERKDRQQMMGEREKNRLRKLKAQEGREWDSEKREEDFAVRGGRGYGRGAHVGVTGPREVADTPSFGRDREDYTDGREYIYRENRGRGRGGRGGRGGERGRGRGGNAGGDSRPPRPPQSHDFPDLPTAAQKAETEREADSAPALSFPAKTQKAESDQQGKAAESAPSPALDTLGQPSNDAPKDKQMWADMVDE